MKRDVVFYLADIVENMDDAVDFIGAISYGDFIKDKKTVNAVVRSIEIIGEAAKHVPAGIQEKNPLVPWKNMAGMRDKCIHDYIGVDYETVWYVVKDDIPEIRPMIQSLLDDVRSRR
jgi:uncharacterized protein with HEPN domain